MRDNYSRIVWIILHAGLLLLFYIGYSISTGEEQNALVLNTESSNTKLQYLRMELASQLQLKNYQYIDSFIKHWGGGLPEVQEVVLSSDNGFVLGRYQNAKSAKNIKEYRATINYSYDRKAYLHLRISHDELFYRWHEIYTLLISSFIFLAIFLYFLVYSLLRLRRENQLRKATETMLHEREQQLEMTLYSIGDGIIATDAEGMVTHMNPVAEQLTGCDESEAVGQPLPAVFEIINALTRVPAENPVKEVLKHGEIVGLANHTLLLSKNGEEHHIADSAAPIKNAVGDVLGTILVFRDVTEDYRLHQELIEREKFQQKMLDGMMTFLAILNPEGDMLFVNKSGLKAIGREFSEIAGKKVYDNGCWDYSEENRNIIKKDVEESRFRDVEVRDIETQSGNGSLFWIDFHITRILDEQGELQYLIAEGRDITERKNAEYQMRRGQKMEALGKLTGGIAHDYNNMLGIIMGYAEMLATSLQGQPELAQYANEIYRSGERGARLTRKLLTFSRTRQAEAEIVNVNEVLRDEVHMLEKTLTPKIVLHTNLQEDLWLTVVDKGDLQDAILNVCINAMHAMPEGGYLTLSTRNIKVDALNAAAMNIEPGDYVEMSVLDVGTGMDKETQSRVFDPFFTTKEDGTGLGLSQVYGFVQSVGGAIKVYSEPGQGSNFIFWFPRQMGDEVVDVGFQELAIDEIRGGNESILIVDDEPGLRHLAGEALASKGYKIFMAESGEEAIHLMEREHIDLMLSDVIMPGMDGYLLANLVQQRFPDIKIQMVSGFSDSRHLKVVDEKLHLHVLQKPYRTVELLSRIRLLLDGDEINGAQRSSVIAKEPVVAEMISEWTDDMEIGVPAIDRQHKKLHELLVWCQHEVNAGGNNASIKKLLDALLEYTIHYFRNEETVMEVCGYPHLENHRSVHKMLARQVNAHIRDYEQGRFSIDSLMELLRHWFFDHNMEMDKAIAEYAIGKDDEIDKALIASQTDSG